MRLPPGMVCHSGAALNAQPCAVPGGATRPHTGHSPAQGPTLPCSAQSFCCFPGTQPHRPYLHQPLSLLLGGICLCPLWCPEGCLRARGGHTLHCPQVKVTVLSNLPPADKVQAGPCPPPSCLHGLGDCPPALRRTLLCIPAPPAPSCPPSQGVSSCSHSSQMSHQLRHQLCCQPAPLPGQLFLLLPCLQQGCCLWG